MEWFVCAIGILLGCGMLALVSGRRASLASFFGVSGPLAAAAAAAVPAILALAGQVVSDVQWAWDMPVGIGASFHIAMDALSAAFVLPIVVISALAAIYGWRYLWAYRASKNLGVSWFNYNVLAASMLLVVVARDGVLFLLAWEAMSLASFFLVMFDDDKPSVRQAGWTYLIATHIGTAFIFALFFLMGRNSGSMSFASFVNAGLDGQLAGAAFLLAVIGFGTKAGLMPLHVWLPEAHPAAPSHVSAVMSGVMIKTGIYCIVRTLTLLPDWQAWWAWTLLGVGAGTGVLGVLYALAQHDLKRLLAYSSVENIGIITLGLGLGVLGQVYALPLISVLGFAGALLHVTNHALFKCLLFLSAGAVIQATHCGQLDRMGGLLKRMPAVAATFMIAAAAVSGLPPLNGFISEFLIYVGAFNGCLNGGNAIDMIIAGMMVIAALALIGGLAAACFTKAFGIVFLGETRDANLARLPMRMETPAAMRWPMIALASACLAAGLLGPQALAVAAVPAELVSGFRGADTFKIVSLVQPALWKIAAASLAFLALLGGLALLRGKLLARRPVGQVGTWDCGYAAPSARMQYTASSFAQPITTLFRRMLGQQTHVQPVEGLFPREAKLAGHATDIFLHRVFGPIFTTINFVCMHLRWLQHGRLQLYVLYIALTLVILFIWKLS